MSKTRRVYQPRVFDGRVTMPDEIERIMRPYPASLLGDLVKLMSPVS